MTRFLLAGAAALGMMTGAAVAQTSTTTTTTVIPPASPPMVTTDTRVSGHSVKPDGDQTATAGIVSRDAYGNVSGSTTTNTSYPFTDMITSTTKSLNTVNGVTTETVGTTHSYPHVVGRPDVPPVTTTESHVVDPNTK